MAVRRFPHEVVRKRKAMRSVRGLMVISSLSAAIAMTVITGCESWGHKNSDERSEGRVVDDKHISHYIETQLKNEPVYKFDQVDVKTFAGVVQLNGFVNTEEQKRRAAEIAQQAQGVTQVVNNLTLKPVGAPTPTGRVNVNTP
jgi:hyperosmotically inducible protein